MIISNRLKIFNFIILIIIIVLLWIFLHPKHWYIKINPLIEEYNHTKNIYDNMSFNIKMKDDILIRNEELKAEIYNLNIDTNILQEEILSLLYMHSNENNVEIEKITFSEITSFINDNIEEKAMSENTNDIGVNFIKVNMSFKCSFNNLLKLIDAIKSDNMYVAIPKLYLLSWDEGVVYSVVDLCFYTIPISGK